MSALTFGSLFTGIGGLDLGLERAGMRCAWQVELDDYATRVLAKHWPDVPRFRDVRGVGGHNLAPVDLVCGGFPCQDISNAGRRAGIDGKRSGLWAEFARVLRVLRPRYALIENVAALLVRGGGRVLADLAALGMDAEWDCIPAAAVGAPHRRDRLFLVAYAQRDSLRQQPIAEPRGGGAAVAGRDGVTRDVADARGEAGRSATRVAVGGDSAEPLRQRAPKPRRRRGDVADPALNGREPRRPGAAAQGPRGGQPDRGGVGSDVAHAHGRRFEIRAQLDGESEARPADGGSPWPHADGRGDTLADANGTGRQGQGQGQGLRRAAPERGGGVSYAYVYPARGTPVPWPDGSDWTAEPDVGRVAHGVPARVDRLRGLGNAVVPQVAEFVGRLIVAHAEAAP